MVRFPRRLRLLSTLLLFLHFFGTQSHAMLEGTFLYFPTRLSNQSALSEWVVGGQPAGYARLVENPAAVWLVLHGNAGQASNRGYIVDLLPRNASVYILEYPGYGLRPGKPSQKSINRAAEEAADWLRANHPALPLNVFGESLGSGPASHLCSLPTPPDRLVLAVPYDNLLSVAKEHLRWLPVRLLMRDKWDNVTALSGYRGPVTIFAATHDQVIPVQHARNLAASVAQVRYVELPCGHNEWSLFDQIRITD